MSGRCFRSIVALWSLALVAGGLGCGDSRPVYTEIKRVGEEITPEELAVYERIVKALPDQKLPEMPAVFVPPPEWEPTRSLAIKELTRREEKRVRDGWTAEKLAEFWQPNRDLSAVVERAGLTVEQFAGLTIAIGAALGRRHLRKGQDLTGLTARMSDEVAPLRTDARAFSSLTPSQQHEVLSRAAWLTRGVRASELEKVPAANEQLLSKSKIDFAVTFPEEFQSNPLDAVRDRVRDEGVPFTTLPGAVRDEDLRVEQTDQGLKLVW